MVAVPEVELFRVNPAGSEPFVTDQLNGGKPLDAVQVSAYLTPTVAGPFAPLQLSAVIAGCACKMLPVYSWFFVCCGELLSATRREKLYGPELEGVPLIDTAVPEVPLRERPCGRDPEAIAQL
jgi:hypothetical protein